MNVTASINWQAANWNYLSTALSLVRQALEARSGGAGERGSGGAGEYGEIDNASFALEQLCSRFGLSGFERDLLLLCAGMELDASFASLCANAQGDPQLTYPTFSLAMSALPQAHWSAIAPHSPLRRWRLIEVGGGKTLMTSPLRIDERILHYLVGVDYLDDRLRGIIEPLSANEYLVPSQQQIAEKLAGILNNSVSNSPILQLIGEEVGSKRAIAQIACSISEIKIAVISANAVPNITTDLNNLMLLWRREAQLNRSVLLLDCDEWEGNDPAKENALIQMIENINTPLIVSSRDRRRAALRPFITFDITKPTKQEQLAIWETTLGDIAPSLNGQLETLTSQFDLSAPSIYAVCVEAKTQLKANENQIANSLWDMCRTQARPHLDELAQRIEPAATWDDLVLPEPQLQVLREIAAHLRQRAKVYEQWGFAKKGARGLGISALFAGSSGTGKTMSAEVLAGVLQLDLYRIDLSSVVSKYIGETEKNLRRVFDAAEGGATILLFDEADAIFGKRSDVKDSHDRYANMEVSYLLQRMEAYQGLAILTTNLKDAIDTAFLRRIRFVVKYPFPDAQQRTEIWRRIFPKNTPTEGLDFNKLARLNVAGGNIRNIALNAAFIAADSGEPVMMKHLLESAKSEYIKLERALTDAEVKGWV
ncbi:ATP-binding protein [Floridanema evergladense]|uniref:ATP-binding protein n=1 Tax=Floridaenema evergladense BLCC-F167 TaxID=3153639 RepID=A0ABV4WKP6_9CYAN